MRFPSPALATACLVLSLTLAGCGSSDSDQAAVATTTAAPTTSTTVDPYAVPEVIDAAYVDKVLKEQWRVRDGVTHELVIEHVLSANGEAVLRALYAGDLQENQVEAFRRGAAKLDYPEAAKTQFAVVEDISLIRSSESCIYAEALTSGAGGTTTFAYVMQRDEPTELNKTGWKVTQFTTPTLVEQAEAC